MSEIPIKEFRRLLRIFERELNKQNMSSCCCGVTITQCHTLMQLAKKDNISLNQLADAINLDKSTVSRTVEGLVRIGMLNRMIPDDNRRITLITLTDQGKDVCQSINYGNDSFYQRVLNDVPEELRAPFLQGFEAFVNSMTLQSQALENE